MPCLLSGVNAESLAGYRVVLSSVLPGTFVDLPGDKLPDGCLWPERQFVKFENYPDLKKIWEAGYLNATTQDKAAEFPHLFILHIGDDSIPDGVYLPMLTGDTVFKPWSPNTYPDHQPGDTEILKLTVSETGTAIFNQVYQAKCVYVGQYVTK